MNVVPTPQDPDPLRVLIVDDFAPVRRTVRSLLEEYRTLEVIGEAADGATAVQLASVLRPDVIVMDVHMPRLDGVEATRLIKAALPEALVIGFSIQYGQGEAGAMRAAGSSAFVSKDRAEDLPQVIQHVTGRNVAGKSLD
ncbi:MAG TPA: response regulator transcription factor [Nitrospiraceae bacterium]|nr:response regulator transcription factor [Nitrospiraceae bacterium]